LLRAHEPRSECEITWWHGRLSGEFIAACFDGLVPIDVIASRPVRWATGHATPPETPRLVTALEELERELKEAGWERIGRGDEWYSHRFRRRSGADAAEAAIGPSAGKPDLGLVAGQATPREQRSDRPTVERAPRPVPRAGATAGTMLTSRISAYSLAASRDREAGSPWPRPEVVELARWIDY
jgi:hypothetical protein